MAEVPRTQKLNDATPPQLGAIANTVTRADEGATKQSWNPPFCGNIDMRIASDGSWHYLGTPIARPALVRLFASVLRKEDAGYRLVTPVEKVGIQVDDAPFVAVEMALACGNIKPIIRLRTNLDEWVEIGAAHPLRFETGAASGIKPYVHIRDELWALVSRAVTHDLLALGGAGFAEQSELFGITSSDCFFPIAPFSEIEAIA